jgi:aminoglycoside phosphotransferase (APT) family kinase protein
VSGNRIALSDEQVRAVLAEAGIAPERLRAHEELAEGTFNSAYRLRMADGPDLVLKAAPDPAAPVMGYEVRMMRTEELFYRTAYGRIPVPAVVHASYERTVAASDLLLMTWCPGRTLHSQRAERDSPAWRRIRTELGGLVAALHRVTGPGFGYPQTGLAADWRTAFLGMFDGVIADARRFDALLPVPADRIAGLVHARASLLDAVRSPALVHFDLWPGNILIRDTDRGPRLSALVDGERAFWGDPLAEAVSLALFGDIAEDTAFLDGYHAAGGILDLDEHTQARLALYRSYLYLIMLVEAVPRGEQGPEHDRRSQYVGNELTKSLAELAELSDRA